MEVRLLSPPDCYLFLSGGDDNALGVTCLKIVIERGACGGDDGSGGDGRHDASGEIGITASVLWQLFKPEAHASALTGMMLISSVCMCVCVLCVQEMVFYEF